MSADVARLFSNLLLTPIFIGEFISKSTTKPKRRKIRAHMVTVPRATSASTNANAIAAFANAFEGSPAPAVKPIDRSPLPEAGIVLLMRQRLLPIDQIISRRLAVRRSVRIVEACGQRVPVRFLPSF